MKKNKLTHNPAPFLKDEYLKNSKSDNDFSRGKVMSKDNEYTEERKRKIKLWTQFYRTLPSVFCEHYLGVSLFPYQRYFLNIMFQSTTFIGLASRASAKSWLIGLGAVAKCILYPGTNVSLNSGTKKQSGLIISEKIMALKNEFPNISREILSITSSQNEYSVIFHNGSKIQSYVSGDSGRGVRSSVAVLEERRLIPTDVCDSIIRPYLVARQPGYLKIEKYSHLIEEPAEWIISSTWYRSHEFFEEVRKFYNMIARGDGVGRGVNTVTLDYLISLKHNLKTSLQMQKEKERMDKILFDIEYGNLFFATSSSAYFKIPMFDRSIIKAWLPVRLDMIGQKNNYDILKKNDEMRVISVDISMRKGASNDNTIISCARLFPTSKGWKTDIVYMESMNGKNAVSQALRIKQIFEQFKSDYLVLDVQSAGLPVFDVLSSVTTDAEFGKDYPAYTVMNHSSIDKSLYDDMSARTLGQNAIPCVYPIMGSPQLNSAIAIRFRDRMKRKLVSFLVDEARVEEFFVKTGNKDIFSDSDDRSYLLNPHIQMSLMVNEAIGLEMSLVSGNVKLQEASGARKDRYSSTSYMNYFIGLMDIDLLKQYDNSDEFEVLASLFLVA